MKRNNSRIETNKNTSGKFEHPTDGIMEFEIEGYLQDIYKSKKASCDYLQFYIDNPVVEGNVNSIQVTLPWSLGECEKNDIGQFFAIKGNIRSFWDKDSRSVKYSFEAVEIDEIEGEEDEK